MRQWAHCTLREEEGLSISRKRDPFSRRSMLVLVGAAAVGALTACAGPSPTATPAPAAAPKAEKPAEKPADVAKPAAAQAAPGKARAPIKFRSWWSPSSSQPMDQWDQHIRKDFPEKHGGVQLDIEYVPFGDYFKKFLAGVASDDVPDALHSSVVWGRDFYDLGTLAELNQYMRSSPDMDPTKLIPVTNLYNQKDGKYYGHSWEGPDGSTIYYNVDMFKEAGIDPAYEKVKNWTWDDVVANAQKLTKRQGDTVDVGGILVAVLGLQHFAAWLYSAGGKFYGDNVQSKAVFADDGKGAQVVEYHLDLLNKHKVSQPLSAERHDTNLFSQE